MKKKISLVVLALISCFMLIIAGCTSKGAEKISVSITNKDALTAVWEEEGENRTIELSIAPDKYTVDNTEVVVSSDNSEVVKADGLTLSATGGGTANVTVSLGNASDTVAITVTPKLRGVSITNKAELGEVWGLGDADRTLDVAKLFKNSTSPLTASEVTVTSSAPDIIEADGLALKAKAIGNDATITVTYGDFSDTVALSVVAALETFEITNKSDLANLAYGATYDLSSYVTFSPSFYDAENTRPVITCEPVGIIEQVNGYQIKALANGSATVTVTVRGKSDTFTASVAYGTPKITFESDGIGSAKFEETEEGGILSVLQSGYYNEETEVILPTVYATTTDGKVVENIEIKKDEEIITENIVKLKKGTCQLTYSAADPRDESKVARKTLTVNVYRNVMASGDTNGYALTEETRYSADDEQVLKNSGNGFSTARFNVAAGTRYYTEVTFVLSAYNNTDNDRGGNPVLGMAHYLGNERARRISLVIGRGSGNVFIKIVDAGDYYYSDPLIKKINNIKDTMSLTAPEGYVFPADTSTAAGNKVKFAIARDGDYFYLFMNDVLIDMRTVSGFEGDTVPAITGDRLSETTMENIVLMDGSDAQNKIETLIPGVAISNKDTLAEKWTNKYEKRAVEADITEWQPHYEGFVNLTVTSDNPDVISVGEDGVTLAAHKNGEATITVNVGNKYDTVKITVELPAVPAGTPVIEFIRPEDENVKFEETDEGATLGVVQTGYYNEDTTVTLPAVIAMLGDTDISDSMTITLDGASTTITGNTVTLSKGTHTVTYTVTNPDNAKSVTKTLTVNVYRKLFSYKGPNQDAHPEWDCVVSKEYAPDSEQEVTTTGTSRLRGVFNMAPSTLYYAEVTFVLPAYDSNQGNPIIGLGHYVGEEKARRLSYVVGRGSGSVFVADFTEDKGNIWDNPIGGSYNINTKTSLTEKYGYIFLKDTSIAAGKKVKLAIARNGNTFYLFMNDVLIEERDISGIDNGYYSAASVPGISADRMSETTMTDIRLLDGTAASNKIAGLIPTPEITNKSAFEENLDQTFTGKIEVSITPDYYNNDEKLKCSFKSSDESIVKVGEDGTLTVISNGEATITVSVGSKTDTVQVKVKLKADTPVLTLTAPADADNVTYTATDEGATLDVVQTGYYNEDTTVTLPAVTAMLGDTDISDSMTITLDGASTTITGNTIALANGTHTIIYTVTNPDNAKSVTKTLTVNVYRKVMASGDTKGYALTDDTRYSADDEQVLKNSGNGFSTARFNVAAGTRYYTEVTFVLSAYNADNNYGGNPVLGMAHYLEGADNNRLSFVICRGSGNVFVKNITNSVDYYYSDPLIKKITNIKDTMSLTAPEGYVFPADASATAGKKVKFAIARDGNNFYLFINDVCIFTYTNTVSDFEGNTVPAITGDRLSETSITNIVFLSGDDATNKINSLTGSGSVTQRDNGQKSAPAEPAIISKKEEE